MSCDLSTHIENHDYTPHTGKLNLRAGTSWKAFFLIFFGLSGPYDFLGVQFPGLFLAGNRAEKPILRVPIWMGGSEDFRGNEGKNPENSWCVAFQGLFFASRTTFSHISGFFLRGFFSRKKPARFLKSHRLCRTEGSENKIVHATLVFQWCPKSLIIPIFKAYERKWPKTLSGKNVIFF